MGRRGRPAQAGERNGYRSGCALFLALGLLEILVPRTMDGLMGKVVGSAYERGASERSRLLWNRTNGIFLLASCVFITFALAGPS